MACCDRFYSQKKCCAVSVLSPIKPYAAGVGFHLRKIKGLVVLLLKIIFQKEAPEHVSTSYNQYFVKQKN